MFATLVSKWEALLPGYKTYIVALVAAVFNFAIAVGWLNPSDQLTVNAILAAFGVAGLRAAK